MAFLRELVVCVYALSAVLALVILASVPAQFWQYASVWFMALTAFSILVSLSSVLLAYWVYEDDKRLSELYDICRSREQDKQYKEGNIRITRVLDKDNELRIAQMLDKKDMWLCPDCKAINSNEEKLCPHCKRIKPQHA